MQLNETGFWCRTYRVCRILVTDFVDFTGDPRLHRTDLCTFIRTIFVWTPLALAINAAAVGFFLYAAAQLFFALWLYIGVVGVVVLSLLAACVTGAAGYGIVKFFIWLKGAGEDSETLAVIQNYMKAKKSKICPLIYFEG